MPPSFLMLSLLMPYLGWGTRTPTDEHFYDGIDDLRTPVIIDPVAAASALLLEKNNDGVHTFIVLHHPGQDTMKRIKVPNRFMSNKEFGGKLMATWKPQEDTATIQDTTPFKCWACKRFKNVSATV
jgi:hypothetical protein